MSYTHLDHTGYYAWIWPGALHCVSFAGGRYTVGKYGDSLEIKRVSILAQGIQSYL